MSTGLDEFKFYPSPGEVDLWVLSVWDMADSTSFEYEEFENEGIPCTASVRHTHSNRYIKFTPEGMDEFYAYWQPAMSSPAPLIVHVPGYSANMNTHPEIVSQGYNVLHINPLGYCTPWGYDTAKRKGLTWPVLQDTILSLGKKGYIYWLANCLTAVKWAISRPEVLKDRISFFGTSQGGAGALLLGSIFKDRGVRCVAADLPFLTNFPMAKERGSYEIAWEAIEKMGKSPECWHSIGFIDTISHAGRLNIPVLLTAGGKDTSCPAETVESLFSKLPGTRSLVYLKDGVHRHTPEFVYLASAWFRLYA